MNEPGMWAFFTHVFDKLTGWHDVQLATIISSINQLKEAQENYRMATEAQFNEVLARIDAAEPKVAKAFADQKAEIVALQEQIKGLGLSSTIEDSILAKTTSYAAFLEALVPTPAPEPTDPPSPPPPAPPVE